MEYLLLSVVIALAIQKNRDSEINDKNVSEFHCTILVYRYFFTLSSVVIDTSNVTKTHHIHHG